MFPWPGNIVSPIIKFSTFTKFKKLHHHCLEYVNGSLIPIVSRVYRLSKEGLLTIDVFDKQYNSRKDWLMADTNKV